MTKAKVGEPDKEKKELISRTLTLALGAVLSGKPDFPKWTDPSRPCGAVYRAGGGNEGDHEPYMDVRVEWQKGGRTTRTIRGGHDPDGLGCKASGILEGWVEIVIYHRPGI